MQTTKRQFTFNELTVNAMIQIYRNAVKVNGVGSLQAMIARRAVRRFIRTGVLH